MRQEKLFQLETKQLPLNTPLASLSFEEIKRNGFPYYQFNPSYLSLFQELCKADTSSVFDGEWIRDSRKNFTKLATVFFPHMYAVKCEGGKRTPLEAFQNDKILKRAIRNCFKWTKNPTLNTLRSKIVVTSGTQGVSNFSPFIAKAIYDRFAPHGKVFDFCAGWGGRLVGFLSSSAVLYVGAEVNSTNFPCYYRLLSAYSPCLQQKKMVLLFRHPCEEFDRSVKRLPDGSFYEVSFDGYFDLCFSSPPYFNKEKYSSDPEQSYLRYPVYKDWLEKFLFRTMEVLFKLTKQNGYIVVVIASEVKDSSGKVYKVGEDLRKTFKPFAEYKLLLPRFFGKTRKSRTRYEFVFLYQKKS